MPRQGKSSCSDFCLYVVLRYALLEYLISNIQNDSHRIQDCKTSVSPCGCKMIFFLGGGFPSCNFLALCVNVDAPVIVQLLSIQIYLLSLGYMNIPEKDCKAVRRKCPISVP
jgi:hypothetical protein